MIDRDAWKPRTVILTLILTAFVFVFTATRVTTDFALLGAAVASLTVGYLATRTLFNTDNAD